MKMITQIRQAMQDVLMSKADGLGRETGFIQRQVKFTGSSFVQTLVFGWLGNPEATLEDLCQTGVLLGVGVTPQGLDQRFTSVASELMRRVLDAAVEVAVTADPVVIPVLQRFRGVYIEDSSIITLPDSLAAVWSGFGGSGAASTAGVKLQVRWDLLAGTLEGPLLSDARTHDRNTSQRHSPLPRGSLRLTDLGYWKLDTLKQLSQAGSYWLSRLNIQVACFDEEGKRWSLAQLLTQQSNDRLDLPVELGCNHRLPARLLAIRVPPEVAQARRRQLKEQARSKGQSVSRARLRLVDWTCLVTNVPAALLSLDDALVLARIRWQIELLFKLWKSHGKVDESRSHKPWRILCELYAKLIGMLIQHWIFLSGNWRFPDRSLFKAAATVRRFAIPLVIAFPSPTDLDQALLLLRRCLSSGCRVNKSRRFPRAFQLLLAIDGKRA